MNSDFPYVLFETNDFLIFYKPPFWKMDTDKRNPPSFDLKNKQLLLKSFNTKIKPLPIYIAIFLMQQYGIKVDPRKQYNIIHRYDVQTSGGIIVAKCPKAYEILDKNIYDKKQTIKIYLALVNGIPEKKTGYIMKKINKKKVRKGKKQFFICEPSNTRGAPACSFYRVVQTFKDDNGNKYSLVQVRIFSGRTHQIRVHMLSIGCSVVNDYKYSSKEEQKRNKAIVDRTFLHNVYLGFNYEDSRYDVKIPLSCDLVDGLKKLKTIKKYQNMMNIDKKICSTVCEV